MSANLAASLPLPQRLALAYAPRRARAATLALFALDARLGQALRQAHEPVMAQMRLAWWRDELGKEPQARERSDDAIRALDRLDAQRDALLALVDGWELLLSEDFGRSAATAFATARAGALLGLARALDAPDEPDAVLLAGQRWALADLAAGLTDNGERASVLALAPVERKPLSRMLRPLAVLDGLARRSIAAGGRPLLDRIASGIAAMRLGLFGH